MINQLLTETENEKRRLKIKTPNKIHPSIDSRRNQQQPRRSPEQRNTERSSDMPISLITPKKRMKSINYDNISIWDIEQNVKSRLKQKDIFLPKIDRSHFILNTFSNKETNYQSPHQRYFKMSPTKQRAKTYDRNQFPVDSQSQNQHYDRTIGQISRLNDRFQQQNRIKKHYKIVHNPYHEPYQEPISKRKQKFNHISRQQDFQRYVDYLENMFNRRKRNSNMNEKDIEKRLQTRVNTNKRSPSKTLNPENYNLSKASERNYQNQQQEENITKTAPQRARKAAHDNFIKVLRKAKNRGESLLVKLSKYPSQKIIK